MSDVLEPALLRDMDEFIGEGWDVYVKWTCPRCGERVMCETPNTFYAGGFRHAVRADGEPCGFVYHGEGGYGYALFGTRSSA